MLVGFLLWDQLPERMATHWGADGNIDGWSGKTFAIIGLPLFLLAMHWICILATVRDPKNQGQNKKVFGMVLWLLPLLSLLMSSMVYAGALGKEVRPEEITLLLMGLLFLVIGNYLPKCKQNYTIGIKVKWTLENEENWNATHRLGGKLWVIGGFLFMACIFLPSDMLPGAFLLLLLIMVGVPVMYSYIYYRKQKQESTAVISEPSKGKKSKVMGIVSFIFAMVVLGFAGILCFTGDIRVQCEDTSFTIEASYWQDLTVAYEAIDKMEYREEFDAGYRAFGFGTPRLSMGTFQNDEFSFYTLYAYTGCKACVVMEVEDKILVLGGRNREETRAIYEELMGRQR